MKVKEIITAVKALRCQTSSHYVKENIDATLAALSIPPKESPTDYDLEEYAKEKSIKIRNLYILLNESSYSDVVLPDQSKYTLTRKKLNMEAIKKEFKDSFGEIIEHVKKAQGEITKHDQKQELKQKKESAEQQANKYKELIKQVRDKLSKEKVKNQIAKISAAINKKSIDELIAALQEFKRILNDELYSTLLKDKSISERNEIIWDAYGTWIVSIPIKTSFLAYYQKDLPPELQNTVLCFKNINGYPDLRESRLTILYQLTHYYSLSEARLVAKEFVPADKEKEFEDDLCSYVTANYHSILEAQLLLEKKKKSVRENGQFPRFVDHGMEQEWEAKVAHQALILIYNQLLTTNWGIGALRGDSIYDKNNKYVNTVYSEMTQMLIAIKSALAKDPSGTSPIWLETFNKVINIGDAAAKKKSTNFFCMTTFSPIAHSFFHNLKDLKSKCVQKQMQEQLAKKEKAQEIEVKAKAQIQAEKDKVSARRPQLFVVPSEEAMDQKKMFEELKATKYFKRFSATPVKRS